MICKKILEAYAEAFATQSQHLLLNIIRFFTITITKNNEKKFIEIKSKCSEFE
jgi:hypothetical protein